MICRVIRHADWEEIQVTAPSDPRRAESAHETLMRAVSALHRSGADVLHANVFGAVAPGGSPLSGPRGIPVSFVEGLPCVSVSGDGHSDGGSAYTEPDTDTAMSQLVTGVQAVGARGAAVTAYDTDDGVSVMVVEAREARWAYITGVHPTRLWATQHDQARDAFDRANAALDIVGMSFGQVIRTWVFVEDILAWYGDLNRARTAFFREHGVFDGIVPASTGVGALNPLGAAVAINLMAVAPRSRRIKIESVPSPMQCSAEDYGSSFSRALEVTEPGLRRLIVSGTASIAPGGETEHVGDVSGQIALTMDVVEAILESRGMGWNDVTRAVAYFRDRDDAPAFDAYRARTGLPELPLLITECTICRDDLLYEIEVDAASPRLE